MAAEDIFKELDADVHRFTQLDGPIKHIVEITPNDSTDLVTVGRGLYVGVSGDVKIDTLGGETVTLVGLAAGVWHPVRHSRIYSTGTSATDILSGY